MNHVAPIITIALLGVAPVLAAASGELKDAPCHQLQRERAEFAAANVQNFFAGIEAQMNFVSLTPQGSSTAAQRRVEFVKLLRFLPAITEVGHVDATGKEEIHVSRLAMDTKGKDRFQEPAFINAKEGATWIGPIYLRNVWEPYLTMSVREHGGKGAVTMAEINLKFLWDVISRIRVGNKGKAYIVDGRGVLVADPEIGLMLRKPDLSTDPVVSQVLSNPAKSGTVTTEGTGALLAGFATLDSLGWKVIVQEPIGGSGQSQ